MVIAIAFALLQSVQVAVAPDTIRVGDQANVAVRMVLRAGERPAMPDTLSIGGDLENAARVRLTVDSLGPDRFQWTAVYRIVPWRPGAHTLPSIAVGIERDGSTSAAADVALPTLNVITVLPADTANIEAKPLRDVLGPNRLWWPIALAILLALIALAALYWWWRRRQKPEESPIVQQPTIPPHDWVVAEIDRIASGPLAQGDLMRTYVELSGVLRTYVQRLDADWGDDLTTTELRSAMRNTASAKTDPLFTILERADLIKFAKHTPDRLTAREDVSAARAWAPQFRRTPPQVSEAA